MTLSGRPHPVPQVQLRYLDLPTRSVLSDDPERFAAAERLSLGSYRELAGEGRGYATAMGSELRARAARAPAVRTVRAHTLPERNASCRVLEKLGFLRTGEVIDPQDGLLWRWDWNADDSTQLAKDQ